LIVGDVTTLGDQEPRLSASEANKITHQKFFRGVVVKCKDCMKPRCLYSLTSPNRMKPHAVQGEAEPTVHAIRLCRKYVIHKFQEAQENEIYVCGMHSFDADDPMHGVIINRNGLECHQPMEFDYYQAKVVATWSNANLCADYCAGSSGAKEYVDERLTQEWRSVLPVCPSCRADGALPFAQTKRRNGEAMHRSGRRAHLIRGEVVEVTMEGGASGVVAPQYVARPTRARVARRGGSRR